MSEKRYERVFLDTNEFIIFDKQEEHRDKGSLYLSENNILKLLNEQDNESKQLKKELAEMKDKAYHYGDIAIGETSSTFDKDMDELRKEIYGEEEAEQIKQEEIKEHQEFMANLKNTYKKMKK